MQELLSFSSPASMHLYHLLLGIGISVCVGGMAYIVRSGKQPTKHP